MRGWEASGEVGVIKAAVPTISEAIDRFFEDAVARGLAEATIGKLNVYCESSCCRGAAQRGISRSNSSPSMS